MPNFFCCFDTGMGVTGSSTRSSGKSGDGVRLVSRSETADLSPNSRGEEDCWVVALVRDDPGREAEEDGREVAVVVVVLVLTDKTEVASDTVREADDIVRCLLGGLVRGAARCSPAEREVTMISAFDLRVGTTDVDDELGRVLALRGISASDVLEDTLPELVIKFFLGEGECLTRALSTVGLTSLCSCLDLPRLRSASSSSCPTWQSLAASDFLVWVQFSPAIFWLLALLPSGSRTGDNTCFASLPRGRRTGVPAGPSFADEGILRAVGDVATAARIRAGEGAVLDADLDPWGMVGAVGRRVDGRFSEGVFLAWTA